VFRDNATASSLKFPSQKIMHSLLLSRLADWSSLKATLLVALLLTAARAAENVPVAPSFPLQHNLPAMVAADGGLRFDFGEEHLVLNRGSRASLLATQSGALIVQGEQPEHAAPSARMRFPLQLATVVSRDHGITWTPFEPKPTGDELEMEGGAIQLRDGMILALDTYIRPGARPGDSVGQLYTSKDDWHTLQGPEEVPFDLPNVDFYASKDDNGHAHEAQRAHRRILELPDGTLLMTFYGWIQGDKTPSTYLPSMVKSRVMLARSTDRGRHWKMLSTVAVDPSVGTEGFGEPVIGRISQGAHAGRLLCLMRTGRNLYEATSDDNGLRWSRAHPRVFAGLDVNRTEMWVDNFRHTKGRSGKFLDENNQDELRGAVVDPDLVELRSGLLVAAFGIRIPQKAASAHSEHPWSGNYLAVSSDHGETWSNVVRLTSGVPTTQYMAIAETSQDNELFVSYDFTPWGPKPVRYVYGRTVAISLKSPTAVK
jgi:hypothetical protein